MPYRGPWQKVNLQVLVNTLDIIDNGEDGGRCLVDVKVVERRVTTNIVKAVCCDNIPDQTTPILWHL